MNTRNITVLVFVVGISSLIGAGCGEPDGPPPGAVDAMNKQRAAMGAPGPGAKNNFQGQGAIQPKKVSGLTGGQ